MSYCPEDGKEMVCIELASETADYVCPECKTHWQYREGSYTAIDFDHQLPESICEDGTIAK